MVPAPSCAPRPEGPLTAFASPRGETCRSACISHHPTVEAHDTTVRTSLRLLAVLNVLFKYA
ncbi:MAG: hypothetical protein OXL36_14580, partial [Bryobacterales bacterium]|nr:hypothetical protein [Bryobacterales bacterium]